MTKDAKEPPDDKPLFMPKANPRDYAQWALEYDDLESKHMKPINGSGFKVHNLKSLRTNLSQRPLKPIKGASHASPKPPPSMSTSVPREHESRKREHNSPLQGFVQKRPKSALAPFVRADMRREGSPASITPTVRRVKKIDKQVLETIIQLVNMKGVAGSRFDIDTRAMDLKWLSAKDIVVPHLNTLATLSTELLHDDGTLRETHPLNSPRSVYVMFNNGVSVADLQKAPLGSYSCDMTHSVRLKKHHDVSRAELHASLTNQYSDICADVSLQDIIPLLSTRAVVESSTANEKRKIEQQRALEATKIRLERQCMDAKRRNEEEIRAEQERERRRRVIEEEKKMQQQALAEKLREANRRKEERIQQIQANHEREQSLIAERLETLTTRDEMRKEKEEEHTKMLRQEREQKRKAKQDIITRNLMKNEEILEETRKAAMEKSAIAEQRKAEKDEQARLERMRGKDQAETVARRRQERLDRVKEETLAKRDKELEKITAADNNHKEHMAKKQKELEVKKHKDKVLADTRREKKEHAEVLMEELRQERVSKLEQQQRQFESVKEEHKKVRELRSDMQTAEANEKKFNVMCKMRKDEFQKALLVQNIHEKEVRIETNNEVKEATLKQCWAERETLKREKQRIMESLN